MCVETYYAKDNCTCIMYLNLIQNGQEGEAEAFYYKGNNRYKYTS